MWPLLPARGAAARRRLLGRGARRRGRLHPVLFAYLTLAAMYPSIVRPHTVLQRDRLVVGDVLRFDAAASTGGRADPDVWRQRRRSPGVDAVVDPSTADRLLAFTNGSGSAASLDDLLHAQLPPLEDVVLGAVPGAVGVTSAVAVIFGGLFLLYRGLIDFRVPVLIVGTAWAAMFVLPLPIGGGWHALAGRPAGVGWATAATFANYEVLASPLLWSAFFLAGSPSVRPLAGRAGRSTP